MIEAEKRIVSELVKDKRLGQDAYLLKDGSLEYKVIKSGREDLRTLQKIKHNYSWVIGVSKSFNPESCLDHTGKPNLELENAFLKNSTRWKGGGLKPDTKQFIWP